MLLKTVIYLSWCPYATRLDRCMPCVATTLLLGWQTFSKVAHPRARDSMSEEVAFFLSFVAPFGFGNPTVMLWQITCRIVYRVVSSAKQNIVLPRNVCHIEMTKPRTLRISKRNDKDILLESRVFLSLILNIRKPALAYNRHGRTLL